jgi:integrase/recombinase XerC
VPVGKAALVALSTWLAVRPPAADGSAALFLSTRGISPRVLQLRLKAHALATEIPANAPARAAPLVCLHVLQSSGDLRAVQEMLGHSSITRPRSTRPSISSTWPTYDRAHPRAKAK